MSRTKLLSWLMGVVALGFFYAGEALAVCCKNSSTGACKCILGTTCPGTAGTGFTSKVTSCSATGGSITLNGSRISCLSGETLGNVSADRATATWTELGSNLKCELQDDSGLNGQASGTFDLTLEYKNVNVTCNDTTGVLTYSAVCTGATPNLEVTGLLKYVGAAVDRPFWVDEMCTNSKGQIVSPCPSPQQLVLGGFQLNNKGILDPKKCQTDFPNLDGQPAGQVLFYTEQYVPGTNCAVRIDAGDAKRRMCHDHTFFNPDPTKPTNPPCDPQGQASFRGGILATDAADIILAPLAVNQWSPGPTLNLACQNNGTVPTTIQNSENFAASSFLFTPGDPNIIAYVQGFPQDFTEATGAQVITDSAGNPTGLRVTFGDCNTPGPGGTGFDEIVCKHVGPNDKTVNLTIQGTRSDGGLGFVGDAIDVKINNATNCPL